MKSISIIKASSLPRNKLFLFILCDILIKNLTLLRMLTHFSTRVRMTERVSRTRWSIVSGQGTVLVRAVLTGRGSSLSMMRRPETAESGRPSRWHSCCCCCCCDCESCCSDELRLRRFFSLHKHEPIDLLFVHDDLQPDCVIRTWLIMSISFASRRIDNNWLPLWKYSILHSQVQLAFGECAPLFQCDKRDLRRSRVDPPIRKLA